MMIMIKKKRKKELLSDKIVSEQIKESEANEDRINA
jgi:hypothetical protein